MRTKEGTTEVIRRYAVASGVGHPCDDCRGSGMATDTEGYLSPRKCFYCDGKGRVLRFDFWDRAGETPTDTLDAQYSGLERLP